MAKAKSLGELLRIREASAARIDQVNGNLGCAVGFKTVKLKLTDEPVVIIFVPHKVPEALLPPAQRIPKQLEGPDGLWCKTDVVVGRKSESEPPPAPLTAENAQIVEELRSGTIGLVGGIQLGGFESDGRGYVGTAACVVRRKADGKIGLLTNQHVGGVSGRPIYHPEPGWARIGFTRAAFEYEPDEDYFEGLVDEANAYYRIDCAFVELSTVAQPLAKPGLHHLGSLGAPLPLDLSTMGPLGKQVVSIGRTRGVQRGTIVAFGYEWYDGEESIYTDYLVIGARDGAFSGGAFSDHGDSGKLIVTDDANHRPVALLWGGWYEKLRKGVGQENWTYAIDVNKALRKLEVEIMAAGAPTHAAPAGPGDRAKAHAKKVARQN